MEHLNEDTKIARILDLDGAQKTIGTNTNAELHFSFHFGFLSEYMTCEDSSGDAEECSIQIDYGSNKPGKETFCGDALVSCWSILPSNCSTPWEFFEKTSLVKNNAKNKPKVCIVTSTIGKVLKIFNSIKEINNQALNTTSRSHTYIHDYHNITYYKNGKGIDLTYWEEKTNVEKNGILAKTKETIFHKRDSNDSGQRYDAENEYRFGMVLNTVRIPNKSKNLWIDMKDIIKKDYNLIEVNGEHYIEQVYLKQDASQQDILTIENACFSTGVRLNNSLAKIFEQQK